MTDPLAGLPAEYPAGLTGRIQAEIARSNRKLIAVDDDPTGVQTVYDTPVLARWTVPDLVAELRDTGPLCFLLTNSRSLPEPEAVRINQEIAANLVAASAETGRGFVIASRSDSTLRGHFPAETDALASILGGIDGVLLVPAFFEGGRLTAGDIHWVRDGDRLVPAAETEFARDATFGYSHSNLREWVAEKTSGRIAAGAVGSISLDDIRRGGPDRVAAILADVSYEQPIVVNSVTYRDLDVIALGTLQAEAAGTRLLYRTGAGFVRVRAGLAERPLLSRQELLGPDAKTPAPGLVVVGSHVRRSSEQLAELLTLPGIAPVELAVPELRDPASRAAEISRAQKEITAALETAMTPVLFTSRRGELARDPAAQLDVSQSISAALVEVVQGIGSAPDWVVGKGGITSSDIGTIALGARRAIVLGQIQPGIPVWRLGPESRYPGLPYVVFPGNVGGPETLRDVIRALRGL
ncbi:MAG: hypothetical protein M3509_06810 [Chloroflexota bacterium]|nr:hypothetical protein [Chloroflexota bacterium]